MDERNVSEPAAYSGEAADRARVDTAAVVRELHGDGLRVAAHRRARRAVAAGGRTQRGAVAAGGTGRGVLRLAARCAWDSGSLSFTW